MKKLGVLFGALVLFSLFSIGFVSAESCDLRVTMINQDPYPAIQGEEVKLVFQVKGVESTECGTIEFELLEQHPITLLPGEPKSYSIESGTFIRNFESFFLAPFKVKVSEDALDGDNLIEVRYKGERNLAYETASFDLNVRDSRADFEVYVKDYDFTTRTMVLEVLNIGESDIEALAIEIPKQEGILVKGASREIVGDLDSNEYTTADFEATPQDGVIDVVLKYSDEINERREVQVQVEYDGSYFEGLLRDEEQKSSSGLIIVAIVIVVGIWYFRRRAKRKKALKEKLRKRK